MHGTPEGYRRGSAFCCKVAVGGFNYNHPAIATAEEERADSRQTEMSDKLKAVARAHAVAARRVVAAGRGEHALLCIMQQKQCAVLCWSLIRSWQLATGFL
jgi:hypothetical protein